MKEICLDVTGVDKELKSLPIDKALAFLHNLKLVAAGIEPELKVEHLKVVAPGVIELKINGSPAYRCVYTIKSPGKVIVLRVFKKTTKEGANKQVISSQADSLIKISRIWADFFPANTSNQPI
ncbi:TPA: type II toxin-antitoxin system RelE/ParE family toxin [Klebsiella pneumoniae]|nr:type II toxin-antitoxin system RelE/ParE family toxin [Klebsiella pneumoniae]HBW1285348.1 type II toxin-antitoxin system RelE/ParE family toxin [Klebsiella pneumoniae]